MSFEIYSFPGRIIKERPKLFKTFLGVSFLGLVLFVIYFLAFYANYRGTEFESDARVVLGPPQEEIQKFKSALWKFSDKKWRTIKAEWTTFNEIQYLDVRIRVSEEILESKDYYRQHITDMYRAALAGFNARIVVRRKKDRTRTRKQGKVVRFTLRSEEPGIPSENEKEPE